ncbi:NUMOD1 domain-containing DNA-binding protein [Maribacter antarcticus]|uniref:NUMOD1 domain-containing DNA-binding protein n=1 Tax=Maribacter antarcticus TaxID=505250 RepID=UPI00047AD014|nr:NUMOD1 domain-containing DNA-binding protein [Maribacter antarcticus]
MMKGIIYKVTNTKNGHSYVGATSDSLNERQKDHTKRANRGEPNKFHNAISTYGPEAFTWELIDTANSTNELAQKEKQYIMEYQSIEKGYNSDTGGGFKKTVYQYDLFTGRLKNTFQCLDNAAKEVNTTKQHLSRACLSINKRFAGYFWSYGYNEPFKPEKDARRKEVLQFNLNGVLLAKYVSVSEASKLTGLSKTCISKCCRGERGQSRRFVWKYVN